MNNTSSANRPWSTLGRVVLFWAGYLAILLLASIPKGMVPPRWGQLVWGVTSSAAIVGLTLLFLKRDRRTLRDVGVWYTASSVPRFIIGALMGLALYCLIVLCISVVAGPIRFARVAAPEGGAIILIVASLMALSKMEELGFRGYPLRTLIPALGVWQAQTVVAVAFGLSHAAFGWPWQSIVLGVIPSAFLFGVAALASGDLAMPIGLHAALNVARWAVGETDAPGIWRMVIDDQSRARLAIADPVIGIAVTALFTTALWGWHVRRQH